MSSSNKNDIARIVILGFACILLSCLIYTDKKTYE